MEEIARKSDKRRRFGFGFFDTPQIREQMSIAAEGGWLRIYVLYLENKPAAFWMGTLYDRCLQADDVGYDPAWSEFSPGIFLFLNILEDLCDADIEIVDFGRGSSQAQTVFRCVAAGRITCPHLCTDAARNPAEPAFCGDSSRNLPSSAHPLPGMGEEKFVERRCSRVVSTGTVAPNGWHTS